VDVGDRVEQGDVIADAGATGSAERPQLHFEIRRGVTPVDPLEHLPSR
jgi:murein DD-endopeptidase MepM/ murein hydrolase activator NlpD